MKTSIGRYTITGTLGEGVMGIARRTRSSTCCAITPIKASAVTIVGHRYDVLLVR